MTHSVYLLELLLLLLLLLLLAVITYDLCASFVVHLSLRSLATERERAHKWVTKALKDISIL